MVKRYKLGELIRDGSDLARRINEAALEAALEFEEVEEAYFERDVHHINPPSPVKLMGEYTDKEKEERERKGMGRYVGRVVVPLWIYTRAGYGAIINCVVKGYESLKNFRDKTRDIADDRSLSFSPA